MLDIGTRGNYSAQLSILKTLKWSHKVLYWKVGLFMKLGIKEVELFLELYPFAKNYIEDSDNMLESNIVKQVDHWLTMLELDEKEIIIQRCFHHKTFDHIAASLGYAYHSSAYRKYKYALNKMKKAATEICGKNCLYLKQV